MKVDKSIKRSSLLNCFDAEILLQLARHLPSLEMAYHHMNDCCSRPSSDGHIYQQLYGDQQAIELTAAVLKQIFKKFRIPGDRDCLAHIFDNLVAEKVIWS